MAFTIGENQTKEIVVDAHRYDSKARVRITTGKRQAKGLPVKVQVHFKMTSKTSYFGYAIGYLVNALSAESKLVYTSKDKSSGTKRPIWTKQLAYANYGRWSTKNGKVITGRGKGDDKNLIKQYGGYYGKHDGNWAGGSSYWKPGDGWLPKDSGKKKGQSVLFDGIVPLSATETGFRISINIIRDYRCSPDTTVENLVWFKFKQGAFDCSVSCSQWKVIPSPPTGLKVTPPTIALENANKTGIRLQFSRGANAAKTKIQICFKAPSGSTITKDVETTAAAKYDKTINPWKYFGTIKKIVGNVNAQVWFRLQSISETGHTSKASETSKTKYTETKTTPPTSIKFNKATYFFEGESVTFTLTGVKNGTFPIKTVSIQATGNTINAAGNTVKFPVKKIANSPKNGNTNGAVVLDHTGFKGWDANTAKRQMTYVVSAVDEAGRNPYSVTKATPPRVNIKGEGATIFQKQEDGSWKMGVTYQLQDSGWKAARAIHEKTDNSWRGQ